MVKKRRKGTVAPTLQENPEWVLKDPDGPAPPPPVRTRAKKLPFAHLEWRDFERLCMRLASSRGEVEQVLTYGAPGQAQFGIDILVRLTDSSIEVWQTKRHKRFGPADVRAAIDLFVRHKWSTDAKRFVLAVACDLKSTDVIDELEIGRDLLQERSIAFQPLDGAQLTNQLLSEPAIVDDFFGRPWVETVCPPEALVALDNRISRFDRSQLREELRDCYASWAATVDPGLPIAGLDRLGRALPAVPVAKRYVKPDVVLQTTVPDRSEQTLEHDAMRGSAGDEAGTISPKEVGVGRDRSPRPGGIVTRKQRIPIDSFLVGTDRAIIAGDAGIGKSALLRVLAADILSSDPQFDCVRENYADFIPIWVSFPLWARMASGGATPPPLKDVVTEFFRAQSEPALADKVCNALTGERTILLVDGLDEASDTTAAQTVAAVLSAFVETHGIPTLLTSRPHGLRAADSFPATWKRVELASLSDAQRFSLAKVWFGVLEEIESEGTAESARIEKHSKRRATSFTAALRRNPGIARLSQTPLFLLALMELHRHGRQLPRSRFAAIEKIVDELVEHQPRRRATDSLLTVSVPSNPRLRDRLLSDFAFSLQSGRLAGVVTDAATEGDAVARACEVIVERRTTDCPDEAEALARSVFEFAEERAGLLVKKAPRNIGFLHLSIQEYLAGRYLAQLPGASKVTFVQSHAGEARWREPILYLLHLIQSEAEVGELMRAIEKAHTTDVRSKNIRDALLTDAAFADLAHDVNVARNIAGRLISEAELTAWGDRQRHLLASAVDGLSSEAVANLCRGKISEWIPNRHGYGRASAIENMIEWSPSMHRQCITVLLRSLITDEEPIRAAAARVLPTLASEENDVEGELLALLKASPSTEALAATLRALGNGWAMDADVASLAAAARRASDPEIAIESIRIFAKRMETDVADLDRYFTFTFDESSHIDGLRDRDLIEHFAETQRTDFIERLRNAINKNPNRNRYELVALIGSLMICDPEDPQVTDGFQKLLESDWSFRDLFGHSSFPVDRVVWTPELQREVEDFANGPNADLHQYELYWVSKVVRFDAVKQRLIQSLSGTDSFVFWSADALAEFWGGGDEEVRAALLPFLDAKPDKVAMVAKALAIVVDDKSACREALLRALHGMPKRVAFLFNGLRHLGVSNDDEEAFEACRNAGEGLRRPLYEEEWRREMILTFPRRREVRELARKEMMCRDGAVGAIAKSYPNDIEMGSALLRVLGPQPEPARQILVSALQNVASVNDLALEAVVASRDDTEGGISFEATIGWVEALSARGMLEAQHVDKLTADLGAVGPDYNERRAAAVAGLAIAGRLDRFVTAVGHEGKPLTVSATVAYIHSDDRIMRRFLRFWDELVHSIGDDDGVIERLGIERDAALSLLEPSWPNAQRVFDALMERGPSSTHSLKHIEMAALARFAPKSSRMRQLIGPVLTMRRGQYWEGLIAGEIFAEHFANDEEFRRDVVARFLSDPEGAAAGALAELLLRSSIPEIEELLRERTKDLRYDVATHFKLLASLAKPNALVQGLDRFLSRDLSNSHLWHFSRWIPAIGRRIERDTAVQDLLHEGMTPTASASVKVSFASLLGGAAGVDERLRTFAAQELRRTDAETMPEVGFDLSSQAHRLVKHVLIELIG